MIGGIGGGNGPPWGDVFLKFAEGLGKSAITLGTNYIFDAIDAPEVVKGFGGIFVSSVIESFIPETVVGEGQPGDPVGEEIIQTQRKSIWEALSDACMKSMSGFVDSLISNPMEFGQLIEEHGIIGALDIVLGKAMQRETVESLFSSTVSIGELVYQKLTTEYREYELDGRTVKEVEMNTNKGRVTFTFDKVTGKLVKLKEPNRILEGDFYYGPDGNLLVKDGYEQIEEANGTVRYNMWEDGKLVSYYRVSEDMWVDFHATDQGEFNVRSDGTVIDGVVEDLISGDQFVIEDGILRERTLGLVVTEMWEEEGIDANGNPIMVTKEDPIKGNAYYRSVYDETGKLVKVELYREGNMIPLKLEPECFWDGNGDFTVYYYDTQDNVKMISKNNKIYVGKNGQALYPEQDGTILLPDPLDELPTDRFLTSDEMYWNVLERHYYEGEEARRRAELIKARREEYGLDVAADEVTSYYLPMEMHNKDGTRISRTEIYEGIIYKGDKSNKIVCCPRKGVYRINYYLDEDFKRHYEYYDETDENVVMRLDLDDPIVYDKEETYVDALGIEHKKCYRVEVTTGYAQDFTDEEGSEPKFFIMHRIENENKFSEIITFYDKPPTDEERRQKQNQISLPWELYKKLLGLPEGVPVPVPVLWSNLNERGIPLW